MKHKSDAPEVFIQFERLIANKFNQSMKVLRIDNGRKYINGAMLKYMASRGIRLETTAPHTPEQNSKAERDNRTIVESARTMIRRIRMINDAKNLPLSLWEEAVSTAVHVLNRTR